MNSSESKEALIDLVIDQIKNDFEISDLGALVELLGVIPSTNLKAYLPEDGPDA